MKERLCTTRKKITHEDVGKDAFFPVFNSDLEFMKKCPYGKKILSNTHRARNAMHHKLIFAIAKCVIANMPDDSIWSKVAPRELIAAIQVAEGIVDIKYNIDGSIRHEPKSIAFESMCEDAFQPVSDAMFKWGAEMLSRDGLFISENDLRDNYEAYL